MFKQFCLLVAAAPMLVLSANVSAQSASPANLPSRLSGAAPCVEAAAQFHAVNPWVLRAILKVESDFNPRAVSRNRNGTVDVGMAQINSIHFRELQKWGIAPENLMDGCVATYVAAWHLARQVRRHGNSWFGVASYHSASPCHNTRYAGLLWNALVSWRVVEGPRVKVVSQDACRQSAGSAVTGKRNREGTGPSAVLAFDEGTPQP